MAQGAGEKGGAGRACVSGPLPVDSSAGYRWTVRPPPHPHPLCLAACHFRIVSAIESLFNPSLSLKRPRTGQPFSYFVRGRGGYFSWQDRSCCAIPNEQLDMEGIFRPFFQPQLIPLSKQMRATTCWWKCLDTGVSVYVHTNTAEVKPLCLWPDVMYYKNGNGQGHIYNRRRFRDTVK